MNSEDSYVVVWTESSVDHKIIGARILAEDDFFIRILTPNGTDIRLAKSALIKIERLGGRC